MNKKLLAALAASASALMLCTACGSDAAESSTQETTAAPVTTAAPESESAAETAESIAAEDIEFEEPVEAKSGDAILAIVDGQWYVQYWGKKDDILTYDAGVAHIEGDGDYTVSVNVGTKGAQFDISGDPENGYTCGGTDFCAVIVQDGTKLFPDMSIEIKEIRVDGKPVEMTAKNYTSSDDGVEMRANIYNHFISNFPDDAHTAEGAVTGDFGEYSSKIINPDDFAKWTTVEVDFAVTGTGDAAATEDGADAEPAAAEESSSEEASESTAA